MDTKLMISSRRHHAEIQSLGIAPGAGFCRQSIDCAPDFHIFQLDIGVRREADGHLFFGSHRQVFAGHLDAQILKMDLCARFYD